MRILKEQYNTLTVKQKAVHEAINFCKVNEEKPGTWVGLEFQDVTLIIDGTKRGNSTVDLTFRDEKGQLYVAATTRRLLLAAMQSVEK